MYLFVDFITLKHIFLSHFLSRGYIYNVTKLFDMTKPVNCILLT